MALLWFPPDGNDIGDIYCIEKFTTKSNSWKSHDNILFGASHGMNEPGQIYTVWGSGADARIDL